MRTVVSVKASFLFNVLSVSPHPHQVRERSLAFLSFSVVDVTASCVIIVRSINNLKSCDQ